MIVLPYPQRRDDILRFVRKHHYSRRCPGVWQHAYALTNRRGAIQAAAIYGPAPYPSIARAFCRDPQHVNKLIWQSRMVAAGISSADLDALLVEASADLQARGFWWITTTTDPVAKVIDGALIRLLKPDYSGEVYHRNGWLFLGTTSKTHLEGFLIDGQPVHCRQGRVTLTLSNVRQHYPDARTVRPIRSNAKHRWAQVLGTPQERTERLLLMRYHVQPYEVTTQPRLLTRDTIGLILGGAR